MELIKRTSNIHDVDVPALLKSKGVAEFMLYEEKYITHGRAFECWWYEYKGVNHFLLKHLFTPHQLFFIQLEENEIFIVEDFGYFLEYGEFKEEWTFDEIMEMEMQKETLTDDG